jgi:hypothetical protein
MQQEDTLLRFDWLLIILAQTTTPRLDHAGLRGSRSPRHVDGLPLSTKIVRISLRGPHPRGQRRLDRCDTRRCHGSEDWERCGRPMGPRGWDAGEDGWRLEEGCTGSTIRDLVSYQTKCWNPRSHFAQRGTLRRGLVVAQREELHLCLYCWFDPGWLPAPLEPLDHSYREPAHRPQSARGGCVGTPAFSDYAPKTTGAGRRFADPTSAPCNARPNPAAQLLRAKPHPLARANRRRFPRIGRPRLARTPPRAPECRPAFSAPESLPIGPAR